jgi:uncharacterized protein (TIGR00297 family)
MWQTTIRLFRSGVRTVKWSGIAGALVEAAIAGLAFGLPGALVLLAVSFGGTFVSSLAPLIDRRDIGRDLQEKQPRTWKNALANGSVATFTAIWYLTRFHSLPAAQSTLMFVASLAAAISDTASHELGVLFGGTPYLITTFRRAKIGDDGAVSLVGTAVGLAVSLALAGIAAGLGLLRPNLVSSAAVGGFVGNLFDSFLGATLQKRGWMGNSSVNFGCTLIGALAALGVGMAFGIVT